MNFAQVLCRYCVTWAGQKTRVLTSRLPSACVGLIGFLCPRAEPDMRGLQAMLCVLSAQCLEYDLELAGFL